MAVLLMQHVKVPFLSRHALGQEQLWALRLPEPFAHYCSSDDRCRLLDCSSTSALAAKL